MSKCGRTYCGVGVPPEWTVGIPWEVTEEGEENSEWGSHSRTLILDCVQNRSLYLHKCKK